MLRDAGIDIEDYDAISIKQLDIVIPKGFTQYIFTSKNGVKGYLRNLNSEIPGSSNIICHCVGEKTSSFLAENGLIVAEIAQNASELGHFLVKKHIKL